MSTKKTGRANASATIAVVSTDGVDSETAARDVTKVDAAKDDDLAGDVAAAVVTGDATSLVEDGVTAVVSQVGGDDGVVGAVVEPRPDGDLPGDTAAAAIGADAITSMDTPQSEPVTGEAGDTASLSADDTLATEVHPDWRQASETSFGNTHPLTFAVMTSHQKMTQPVLSITPKVAGFRRGGIAHPAGVTSYTLFSLSPSAIEAILGEPALVVEIV